jgi:predicted DNA repair protein MutK
VTSGLLALLDDIATLLDDVAVLTRVTAQKTAGVLGDDLALNAQQVAGVRADRELPVVWAVAKGSFVNKAILVPAALAVSAFAPWAVRPLLMLGGAYLCYEGVEKLAHRFLHSRADDAARHGELVRTLSNPAIDVVAVERARIKGAVRTDFVLSAEIIVIALGIVANAPFATRVAVLVSIALLMTVGVYGLVGGIVKLDDAGLYLTRRAGDTGLARVQRRVGAGIVTAAPWLMKGLSVLGTAAMFLVGGGILVHGVPALHHWIEGLTEGVAALPGVGGGLRFALPFLLDAVMGVVAGALVLAVVSGAQRVMRPKTAGA